MNFNLQTSRNVRWLKIFIPVKWNFLAAEKAANTNDAKNVENGTADDGTDAQVGFGDEGSHDICK